MPGKKVKTGKNGRGTGHGSPPRIPWWPLRRGKQGGITLLPAWARLLLPMTLLSVWAGLGLAGIWVWLYLTTPSLDTPVAPDRRPAVTVISAQGDIIASQGDHAGPPVPFRHLPQHLYNAVIAIEDARFPWHAGIDPTGMLRSLGTNLRAGRIVQGGSTITQQLARLLFLERERTISRKLREMFIAIQLERRLDKETIFTEYINRIYFGSGSWGIAAAARIYFGVKARALSLAQSAMLAGLIRAPSRYSPLVNLAGAQARAAVVLDRMEALALAPPGDIALARRFPAIPDGRRLSTADTRYFADWAITQAQPPLRRGNDPVTIRTTLDTRLQTIAETVVHQVMTRQGRTRRASQAALVAMDTGGAIRAMVGGMAWHGSRFNRAVQALRQPGSAFKLFVFATALEAGMTPESPVTDLPVTVDGWSPGNFDGQYRGVISLETAAALSVNTVPVRLGRQAGYGRVLEMARRLGVTIDQPPHPSLVLGTAETSLLDLTTAYAVVAAGGRAVRPLALLPAPGHDPERRLLSPQTAAMLHRLLRAVVLRGTGKAARAVPEAAGKTGTTQNYRDAWFIGYAGGLVCGVWVGNDDNTGMKGVTGGGLPAHIWTRFMSAALK